jgi:hypothetical protein
MKSVPSINVNRRVAGPQVWSLLAPALLGLAIFWVLIPIITAANPSPAMSLASATLCGAIGLLVCLELMVKAGQISRSLVFFGLAIYLIRIIFGILHYLILFDGSYFSSSNPVFFYINDYEFLSNSASFLKDYWDNFGFGTFPPGFFDAKNQTLIPYFGLIYFLGENNHFLNFTVLNSLHACLVAVIVTRFAYFLRGATSENGVFIIAMIQPFGFLASVQWRDSVGQFFLIGGSLLVLLSSISVRSMLTVIVGALMMMSLRNIYFVNALIVLSAKLAFQKKKNIILLVGGIVLVGVLAGIISLFSQNILVYEIDSGNFIFNFQGSFGYNLFRNIFGPFPWTQGFDPRVAGHEFMFEAVLQSCFNLSIIYMIFISWRAGAIDRTDPIYRTTLVFVASIIIMGAASYGHSTYMTVASVLLLPLIRPLSLSLFMRVFGLILFTVLSAGALWAVFGLGSS